MSKHTHTQTHAHTLTHTHTFILLPTFMVEKDEAEGVAKKSGCTADWQTYCKLTNYVTELNKKKSNYYETRG